jgi:hydroxymethylbilane synthase
VPQSLSAATHIRLGTRGSPLALYQAYLVQAQLAAAHGLDPAHIVVEKIRTTGDQIQDRPLADAGGKALFTKEIEEALIEGRIDFAVHSAKDMATRLPDGLVLAACLAREDARDAFVCREVKSLTALPPGAVVGTTSPRRQAMVKRLRPDLRVVSLRGNVETRLRKLDEGAADATILALAGLKRLGLESAAASILEVDEFLPAAGQGAIAIETRADDRATRELLTPINDAATMTALLTERDFLAVLDGSCRAPIAGYATVTANVVRLRGMILKPDGSQIFETAREGPLDAAASLGADAGRELKARGGPRFFEGL